MPVADDLVAHPRQRTEGNLVRHGAGGHPDGRLLAQHRCDAILERVDAGVLAVDVVADLGGGHGLAHARSGAGDGVAAEIDGVHWMLRAKGRSARRGRSPLLREAA